MDRNVKTSHRKIQIYLHKCWFHAHKCWMFKRESLACQPSCPAVSMLPPPSASGHESQLTYKWCERDMISPFSPPAHQIEQPGQWPCASKYDTVITPLVTLWCSSIKSQRSQGVVRACWTGHTWGSLPGRPGFECLCVIRCQGCFVFLRTLRKWRDETYTSSVVILIENMIFFKTKHLTNYQLVLVWLDSVEKNHHYATMVGLSARFNLKVYVCYLTLLCANLTVGGSEKHHIFKRWVIEQAIIVDKLGVNLFQTWRDTSLNIIYI